MKILTVLCFTICANKIFFSFAWALPDRCRKNYRKKYSHNRETNEAEVTDDIEEFAKNQTWHYSQTYKDHEFIGPLAFAKVQITSTDGTRNSRDMMLIPKHCMFTSVPKEVARVNCSEDSRSCHLEKNVSTTNTYSSIEGFKWGADTYNDEAMGNIIRVGGEATTEAKYNCTTYFTKELDDSTDSVACAVQNTDGSLHLYSVTTDWSCDFFEKAELNSKSDFSKISRGFSTIIPFTTEYNQAAHKYACVFTPKKEGHFDKTLKEKIEMMKIEIEKRKFEIEKEKFEGQKNQFEIKKEKFEGQKKEIVYIFIVLIVLFSIIAILLILLFDPNICSKLNKLLRFCFK